MSRLTDALDAHQYCGLGPEWDDPNPADYTTTDDEADQADMRAQAEIEAGE
ncbi:MAG: hypothetical protein ABWZ77_05150 [Naasia sp.]